MEIIRVIKNKDYTVISNNIFKNKNLSLKAKGLMSLLLSLSDNWDLHIEGLTKICKEGRRSIGSTINELIENKYIKRDVKRENGVIKSWTYTVYETPQAHNEDVDNVDVENVRQYNTIGNKISINKDLLWVKEVKVSNYPNELKEDFLSYWLETSKSGKTRQSMQKTWNTERRLKTWAKNDKKWNRTKTSKIDAQIDSYVGALNLLEEKYERTN
tara:strand:+ start:163 stop:804 length:642 start_codon:yes stop_codon:yes gene_type:complete